MNAHRVAAEHVVWAAGRDIKPRELLRQVGINWPRNREPDWHACVDALAVVWRRLQRPALQPPECPNTACRYPHCDCHRPKESAHAQPTA